MIKDGYYGCEEFLHRLPLFLDGEHEAADDRLLQEHLSWCEKCLAKYRFERRLIDSVRSTLARVPVPDHLAGRIAALLARSGRNSLDEEKSHD